MLSCFDLFKENIRKVGEPSEDSEKTKAAVLRTEPSDCRRDFIYSVQTLSSKDQAKELLHQHVAQVWWTRTEWRRVGEL